MRQWTGRNSLISCSSHPRRQLIHRLFGPLSYSFVLQKRLLQQPCRHQDRHQVDAKVLGAGQDSSKQLGGNQFLVKDLT
jgi:hypothetical protein